MNEILSGQVVVVTAATAIQAAEHSVRAVIVSDIEEVGRGGGTPTAEPLAPTASASAR